ncbi:MAG: BatD family protein [Phycisphaerales bacterium JB039]
MRALAVIAILAPAVAVAGPIETSVQTGPLALLVRAERSSLSTAETLRLRLEATCPPGVAVRWPELGQSIGEFSIIDQLGLPPKRTDDGRHIVTRIYTLAPFLAGEYEIPSIAVEFEGEDRQPASLRSQPMRIEVRSVLDEPPEELTIGEPLGPAPLPAADPGAGPWPWIAGAAGAGAIAAIAIAAAITRRARREGPAHDPVRTARVALAAMRSGDTRISAAEIDGAVRPALCRLLGAETAGATSLELVDIARRLVPAATLAKVERYLAGADEALFSGAATDDAAVLEDATASIEALVAWRTSLREASR